MTQLAITKMSSKGQIVIPSEMRKDLKDKEEFMIIKNGKEFILKSTNDFDKNIKDELIFAKRIDEAFKRYGKGLFKRMPGDEFLKELEKW